jgi:hypothetical protein
MTMIVIKKVVTLNKNLVKVKKNQTKKAIKVANQIQVKKFRLQINFHLKKINKKTRKAFFLEQIQ